MYCKWLFFCVLTFSLRIPFFNSIEIVYFCQIILLKNYFKLHYVKNSNT